MVNVCPDIPDFGLYTRKETYTMLEISATSLRRYSEMGLITFRYRRCSPRPVTTGREIKALWRPGIIKGGKLI